jgi:hypothetical protein
MARDIEVAKESEYDEDSLAKAKTLVGTLCEALSDSLAPVRHRGPA